MLSEQILRDKAEDKLKLGTLLIYGAAIFIQLPLLVLSLWAILFHFEIAWRVLLGLVATALGFGIWSGRRQKRQLLAQLAVWEYRIKNDDWDMEMVRGLAGDDYKMITAASFGRWPSKDRGLFIIEQARNALLE